MSTPEQRADIARRHGQRLRAYIKANADRPSCAYCGIMVRNHLQAALMELADGGGLICDRCVREAERGARMTRDVT